MNTHKSRRWPKVLLLLFLLFLLAVAVGYFLLREWFPLTYQKTVATMSQETGIPESLIFAVIHTESGFRPEVESYLGARGLMQLTEETYDWVKYRKKETETTYEDLFQPEINIRYGAWLLQLLEQEFSSQSNVLSAYHAGWGNVKGWLANQDYSPDGTQVETIPFRDTAHYVYKVQQAQKIYQLLYQIP